MDQQTILEHLEKIVADLDIEVRYEKGRFQGGYYRYKDKRQFVLNKELNVVQRINILAREIRANVDLDSLYVIPAVREVIENAGHLG